MRIHTMRRTVASFLVAALAVSAAGVPSLAQSSASDWQVVQGPDLEDLSLGTLATDASGTVVLAGFSGSLAPRGKKPLAATALAWSSPDGSTWTEATLEGAKGAASRSVSAGPGGFVAVVADRAGARMWHSPDGMTWTDTSGDAARAGHLFDVAGGPAGYVAVGLKTEGKGKKRRSVPTAWQSADGSTWTPARISDDAGTGVSVAAAPDGSGFLAAVFQPERKGPTSDDGTFQVLPPGLSFFASSDGLTWAPTAPPPATDATTLAWWDLTHAAGRYHYSAMRAPGARDGSSGHFSSADGAAWTAVTRLLGLDGATGAYGEGVIALGDGAIAVSQDGSTWASSVEDILSGVETRSIVSLADGRVLATGPTAGGGDPGYALYAGTPPTDGTTLPSDCVDAAVLDDLMSLQADVFALPPVERERMAASLAAFTPADPAGYVPDDIVLALRAGESLEPSFFLGLLSDEVEIPACA